MANKIDHLIYRATQRARTAWYSAHYAAAMRLDYALLSPSLARACAVTSGLVRDADTEKLSDHYPLLTDLDCEAW